jgi:hypothetical protein
MLATTARTSQLYILKETPDMPITQDTDGTWGFTVGAQRYGGYQTRQAAQEAQYDAERGQAPAGDYDENDERIALAKEADRVLGNEDEEAEVGGGEDDEVAFDLTTAQIERILAEISPEQALIEGIDRILRPELAEDAAPAAIVLAHIDQIAKTEEERRYIQDLCADDAPILVDWAKRLTCPPVWLGIKASPGAEGEFGSTDGLGFTPRLSVDASGDLFVQLTGHSPTTMQDIIEERFYDAPAKVHELITLKRRGLVIMDTDEEVIVMTHQECAEQEGFTMDEGVAELAELSLESRVFASVVRGFFESVPETHRSMGEAGMMLLALACDGVGAADKEGADPEELYAAQVYRIAYEQGHRAGREATIDEIDRRLKALDRAA